MKSTIIKLSLCAIFLSFSMADLSAQARKKADKDTQRWRYEIECMGVGAAGTKLIRVWSYSKKPHVAEEQAKKNAIHGMVFKGYSPAAGSKGCAESKPLARNSNLEMEKADFFKPFFADNGKYMKFVNLTGDGKGAPDVMKSGKKEYKVGVTVSVRYDALRKDLEDAGIIKSMSSGFGG